MSAPTLYMFCFFASNIYSSFTRRGLHVHINTLQYLCCWKKLSAVYLLCFVHISWCHQWCSKIIFFFLMMVVMKWKYVSFFLCVFCPQMQNTQVLAIQHNALLDMQQCKMVHLNLSTFKNFWHHIVKYLAL